MNEARSLKDLPDQEGQEKHSQTSQDLQIWRPFQISEDSVFFVDTKLEQDPAKSQSHDEQK